MTRTDQSNAAVAPGALSRFDPGRSGKDWFEISTKNGASAANELGVEILPRMADYEVTQQVFEKLVEEKTFDPLFVTHCPKELVPLAKQNAADDRWSTFTS